MCLKVRFISVWLQNKDRVLSRSQFWDKTLQSEAISTKLERNLAALLVGRSRWGIMGLLT